MSGSLRQRLQGVSVYLVALVVIATLGPLQFGYHLVSPNRAQPARAPPTTRIHTHNTLMLTHFARPSSTPPKTSSPAAPRSSTAPSRSSPGNSPTTRHGSPAAFP